MARQISGQLHWDTTHAATHWLLFLHGFPGDTPDDAVRVQPAWLARRSHAEVAHLIGAMLRENRAPAPAGGVHPD